MRNALIPALQVLTPQHVGSPRDLHIGVVFTDFEDTRAALKAAARLSAGLEAAIDLVVPHIVPFPLPLAHPTVPPQFTLQRLLDLTAATDVQAAIYIYFCRDRLQTLLEVLERHSVIVVGSRKRWFPTQPERLAKALCKSGRHVILARRP